MLSILKNFEVEFLVDVRSIPYSKQYPQCNSDNLEIAGAQLGVKYMHMAEVGAKASEMQDVFSKASNIFFDDIFPISKSNRPEDTELHADDEIVDFNKFRHDEYFATGLKRIETAYDKGFTLALMCSEKNPMDCHRYFLISRALEQKFGDWLEVKHIIRNKKEQLTTISNEELNNQLKETIFKKTEIKKLDLLSPSFENSTPSIDNYYGDTLNDKIADFCDRYWNLMHGWKRIGNNTSNKYNFGNYD
jgi:uncharacterized protein (DUF488 family)